MSTIDCFSTFFAVSRASRVCQCLGATSSGNPPAEAKDDAGVAPEGGLSLNDMFNSGRSLRITTGERSASGGSWHTTTADTLAKEGLSLDDMFDSERSLRVTTAGLDERSASERSLAARWSVVPSEPSAVSSEPSVVSGEPSAGQSERSGGLGRSEQSAGFTLDNLFESSRSSRSTRTPSHQQSPRMPSPTAAAGPPPLPHGWKEAKDAAGLVYYWNWWTRETTYTRPMPKYYAPDGTALRPASRTSSSKEGSTPRKISFAPPATLDEQFDSGRSMRQTSSARSSRASAQQGGNATGGGGGFFSSLDVMFDSGRSSRTMPTSSPKSAITPSGSPVHRLGGGLRLPPGGGAGGGFTSLDGMFDSSRPSSCAESCAGSTEQLPPPSPTHHRSRGDTPPWVEGAAPPAHAAPPAPTVPVAPAAPAAPAVPLARRGKSVPGASPAAAPAAASDDDAEGPLVSPRLAQRAVSLRAAAELARLRDELSGPGRLSERTSEAVRRRRSDPQSTLASLVRLAGLGAGQFGAVTLVRDAEGRPWALKAQWKGQLLAARAAAIVVREARLLRAAEGHPFIVRLERTFQDARRLYMLIEPVLGGELYSLLHVLGSLGDEHARFCAACVLSMLEHLHDRRIVYRDLKPENLLLDAHGYLKLVDFGLAKRLDAEGPDSVTRTVQCAARPSTSRPRSCAASPTAPRATADWRSLGMLLFEMLSGCPAFRAADQSAVCRRILHDEPRLLAPNVGAATSSAMLSLLDKQPATRLGCGADGAAGARRHGFFAAVDWEALRARRLPAPYVPTIAHATDTSNAVQIDKYVQPAEEANGERWDRWLHTQRLAGGDAFAEF